MEYRARLADKLLRERLSRVGAVLIEGAKACGKTETARQQAASEVRLDVDTNARSAGLIDPKLILPGATPRLIDEWQVVSDVWNAVRREVDERQSDGQFILTGSSSPADDATRHSGAGRFSRLRMRPMTLLESNLSTGAVSLKNLLAGIAPEPGESALSVSDIAALICSGGWPGSIHRSELAARRSVQDYVTEIVHGEIRAPKGTLHDPLKLRATMISLARNIATPVSIATITADVATGESGLQLQDNTVADYLNTLQRLLVLEPLPVWAPHLRSRARVRTRTKQHFVDPSVAVAVLKATPDSLLADFEYFGYAFESLVLRDIRVYADMHELETCYYRDSNGLEVDVIVTDHAGCWGCFEVKLGSRPEIVDEAAANLLRFATSVDAARSGTPACLTVITGSGYAYRRPDGVNVVPIGLLGI